MSYGKVESLNDFDPTDPKLSKRHTTKVKEMLFDLQDESPEKIMSTIKDYLIGRGLPIKTIRMLEEGESYYVKVGIEIALDGVQYQFTIKNKEAFDELFKNLD